jgi:hypothetical protein
MKLTLHPWAIGTLISDADDADEDFLEVDADVEVLAEDWRAIQVTSASLRDIVFVDGARRHDANAFLGSEPCLLVVMAAGAVLTGPGRQAELVEVVGPLRFGVLAGEMDIPASGLVAGELRYEYRGIAAGPQIAQLNAAAQYLMREAETDLSRRVSLAQPSVTVVMDGPRAKNLPSNVIGFLKTVAKERLPADLAAVVHSLPAGRRTPIYRLLRGDGGVWEWALRPRPARSGSFEPAGTVRVQADGRLPLEEAVGLADWSARALGRYSSDYHQDGRAPQQLLIVKGLEVRLRALFGHPDLVGLALRTAAMGGASW